MIPAHDLKTDTQENGKAYSTEECVCLCLLNLVLFLKVSVV